MRASSMIVLVWKHIRPRLLLRSITMAAVCKEDVEYQKTVAALNGLQTNASVLEQVRKERKARQRSAELMKMHQYLERTGLKVEDLDQMNAIHVTGTKGKGSVCAMTESILRAHGLKTGFYSSPHLLEVRERIRINGRPLSKAQFSSYFWHCHNKLTSTMEDYSGTMPAYFRFLTVMAFNVFLREKVDVAIVEVGIGGTYDSTNIIPNPRVCVITSLGYDHVDVLGETLAKIAWQKGGICKPGHPAFTIPQLSEPLKALAERAQELKASSFHVAPDLSEYPGQQAGTNVERTMEGVPVADTFHLPPEFHEGLQLCRWAGRNQIVRHRGVTYFLDGAHTPDSVKASAEWFVKAASEESQSIKGLVVRVLLFNLTGRRDNKILIQPLTKCDVHYAVFCPNIAHSSLTNSADMTNLRVTVDDQFARCKAIEQTWLQLHTEQQLFTCGAKLTNESSPGDHVTLPRTTVFSCVDHALHWITSGRDSALPPPSDDMTAPHPLPPDIAKATHIQLLVTGSLHLVGTVMSIMGYTVDDV